MIPMLPSLCAIKRTSLEPWRSKIKVKVSRPINAHTVNAQYLPNGKAYELQTWYTGGARRPVSPTSAVTFKVKGQGRRSRSQGHVVRLTVVGPYIMSRSKSFRNTKIGGIVAPTTRSITGTRFEVKSSKVKITRLRLIDAETESVSPTNLKLGRRLEQSLSTVMASYTM